MGDKLQGFFDAAKQKAGEIKTAKDEAAAAEERRQTAQTLNTFALKEKVQEELGGILDVLKDLPEKDKKRFIVFVNDDPPSYGTEARCNITIDLRANGEQRYDHHYDDGYPRTCPKIGVTVTRKEDGEISTKVTHYYELDRAYKSSYPDYKTVSVPDFDAARREIGTGIAAIAADRIEEIGKALGAAEDARPAAAPGDKIVLPKTLQFRQAVTAPKEKPAPVQETPAAAAETPAPKRSAWAWAAKLLNR